MKELHEGYSINLRQLAIRAQITFELLQKVGNLLTICNVLNKTSMYKIERPM
jgi:hypothetical protein